MGDIQLSVLFATRNGERVLDRTLRRYLELQAPAIGWELIVVDNGSTDGSATILDRYRSRLPLRVMTEPRAGKNRALNAGLGARRGELLVLTDDDAIPDFGFLVAWEMLLARHIEYDLLGGRIRPLFDVPPPAWLVGSPEAYAMMFAERDLQEGEVIAGESYGPNMAVRGRVLDAGHRFDENIGPNADDADYPMGSETEFCFRMERTTGARSWFARGPLVDHVVRPEQWSEEALVRRSFRGGRGKAYIMHAHGKPVSRPRVTLLDRLCLISPVQRQRYRALRALHLQRGFDFEDHRWNDSGEPARPA
jgi:glycosyltransferase involved in cell wall biosynthesis